MEIHNKYSVQVDCQVKNCRYNSAIIKTNNTDDNSCTKGAITICSRNVTIGYPVVICKTYEKKGE